jgi:NAD(P)-dependent dehydrogenase (short-subunit alcohol dehydrogenase family)
VELDGSNADTAVADDVVREIEARGGAATAAYQDVRSREACRDLVAGVLDELGRLDAAILSVGVVLRQRLEEVSPAGWDETRRVHVEAPLWISQAAFGPMRERGYGRIVLTVSGHGLYRTGRAELVAYSVGKAAAFGLMNVLADAGEPFGIRANAVSPVAATRMYTGPAPAGELLPEQVAPGVVYLASASCSVSGVVLRAAGGRFSLGRYGVTSGVDLGRGPATPEDVAAAWPDIEGPLDAAE